MCFPIFKKIRRVKILKWKFKADQCKAIKINQRNQDKILNLQENKGELEYEMTIKSSSVQCTQNEMNQVDEVSIKEICEPIKTEKIRLLSVPLISTSQCLQILHCFLG